MLCQFNGCTIYWYANSNHMIIQTGKVLCEWLGLPVIFMLIDEIQSHVYKGKRCKLKLF